MYEEKTDCKTTLNRLGDNIGIFLKKKHTTKVRLADFYLNPLETLFCSAYKSLYCEGYATMSMVIF